MNVTETSEQLMRSMTAQQIENALRKAQAPRKVHKSHKNGVRGKGKKKDLAHNAGAVNKNTRPVNSYMAFRSFYSTIFSNVQQKEISGFVTYMWHADPFKAKWTILAKAYSAIRDVQGKANAPLDQFLAMNTPLLGIIEPDQYLEALGWKFVVEADGHLVVQREDRKFEADVLSTNISVNGVLQNCYTQGYFTGRLPDVLLTNDETTMTILQPSLQIHGGESGEGDTTPSTSQAEVSALETTSVAGQGNDASDLEVMKTNLPAPNAATDAPLPAPFAAAPEVPQHVVSTAPTEPLLPADFRLPPGDFALDEAFDPLLYEEQPVFDPFAGNPFDAFDWMDGWDEYINFNACS